MEEIFFIFTWYFRLQAKCWITSTSDFFLFF